MLQHATKMAGFGDISRRFFSVGASVEFVEKNPRKIREKNSFENRLRRGCVVLRGVRRTGSWAVYTGSWAVYNQSHVGQIT